MKRKSLAHKINECLRHGTIKTFTKEDAIEYHKSIGLGDEQNLKDVERAYNIGKVLCLFTSFNESIETVSQVNYLPDFITNIVYIFVTE